jgi:hypothetical protein
MLAQVVWAQPGANGAEVNGRSVRCPRSVRGPRASRKIPFGAASSSAAGQSGEKRAAALQHSARPLVAPVARRLVAHSAMSSTTSTGGWSASLSRTRITRSVRYPAELCRLPASSGLGPKASAAPRPRRRPSFPSPVDAPQHSRSRGEPIETTDRSTGFHARSSRKRFPQSVATAATEPSAARPVTGAAAARVRAELLRRAEGRAGSTADRAATPSVSARGAEGARTRTERGGLRIRVRRFDSSRSYLEIADVSTGAERESSSRAAVRPPD